jgi:hypothetical protein
LADNTLITFYIIKINRMSNSVLEMIVKHKRIIPVILALVAIGLYMIPTSALKPASATLFNGGGYGNIVVGNGGIGGAGGAGGVGGNGGENINAHNNGANVQQYASGGSANGGNGGSANGGSFGCILRCHTG